MSRTLIDCLHNGPPRLDDETHSFNTVDQIDFWETNAGLAADVIVGQSAQIEQMCCSMRAARNYLSINGAEDADQILAAALDETSVSEQEKNDG